MRLALSFAVAIALAGVGCIAPITPMERLQQSANEVAAALRFDRTDLVAEYVAPAARDDFFARHAVWSEKVRVMDLELGGIFLRGSDVAEAMLIVSWMHEDGATLHTTVIAQQWKQEGGGFRMVDETYRKGDKTLFEMLPKKEAPKTDQAATEPATKVN